LVLFCHFIKFIRTNQYFTFFSFFFTDQISGSDKVTQNQKIIEGKREELKKFIGNIPKKRKSNTVTKKQTMFMPENTNLPSPSNNENKIDISGKLIGMLKKMCV